MVSVSTLRRFGMYESWADAKRLRVNLMAVLWELEDVVVTENFGSVQVKLKFKWYARYSSLGLWPWLVRFRVRKLLNNVGTEGVSYTVL